MINRRVLLSSLALLPVPGSSFHNSELFCPKCLTEKLIWPKKARNSRHSEKHGCS